MKEQECVARLSEREETRSPKRGLKKEKGRKPGADLAAMGQRLAMWKAYGNPAGLTMVKMAV
jgi:hypothetical protein